MIFVGVALLVAFGIALAISADAGSLVGLTQMQTGQLIPLVLILILVASSVFARGHKFGEIVSNLLIWIGISGVLLVGYSYRDDLSRVADRVMGELRPGAAIVDTNTGAVRVNRAFGGSYRINADVNGSETPMIFDTGATAVVLSSEDARRAGFDTRQLRYTVPVQTANGMGRAASVVIDELRVGSILRSNIRAFVTEEGALETSLLGMTFLDTLSRYAVSQDSLEMFD